MRSTYIRPLKFDYVDANEQRYRISEIPVKFLEEKDDYQKRKTKTETVLEQPSPSEQFVEEQPVEEPLQPTLNHQHLEPQQRKVTQPRRNQSLFGCCQSGIQEGEMCSRCLQSLCPNCINNPQSVKFCTKCLQKLCHSCKTNLKIAFPDYKLRNYAINIKNYHNLHFNDCPCKHCQQT